MTEDADNMLGTDLVAYTKFQQQKNDESERLRGEGNEIKFVDVRFKGWQVVEFRKGRRKQDVA